MAVRMILLALMSAITGCMSTGKNDSYTPVSTYQDRMLVAGNVHCRMLAATLAEDEPDREFGGYDPEQFVVKGKKTGQWLNACRLHLADIIEWHQLNIINPLKHIRNEYVRDKALDDMYKRHGRKIAEMETQQRKILIESGLYAKHR